jgi:hypothetical protein
MIIKKSFKGKKLTSFSITFEDDEEIGCLEDMIAFSETELANHFEYRNILPEIVAQLKHEIE